MGRRETATRAVKVLREGIRNNPEAADLHFNLAQRLSVNGETRETIRELRCVLQIDPEHVAAHQILASHLGRRGENEEAIELLHRAIAIRPDPTLHCDLAVHLMQQGHQQEAVKEAQKALKMDPDNAPAKRVLQSARGGRPGGWKVGVMDQVKTLSDRLRGGIAPAVLFMVVVAFYWPTYSPSSRYGFIYDDHKLILEQAPPRSVGDVFGVFIERHWPTLPYYRPVARSTMVAQKGLHGDRPAPYHLFNAVLMGVAALLAFALFRLPAFAIRALPAFLSAALLAVHPVASCTVYPICSGRETLLAAAVIIVTMYAYLVPARWGRTVAVALFAVSLLCKESAVIVPGLFVLADALGLAEGQRKRSVGEWIRRYAPVAAILLVYFLLRGLLFGGMGEHRLAVLKSPTGPPLSLLFALQTTVAPYVELVYEPPIEVWLSKWRLLVSLVGRVAGDRLPLPVAVVPAEPGPVLVGLDRLSSVADGQPVGTGGALCRAVCVSGAGGRPWNRRRSGLNRLGPFGGSAAHHCSRDLAGDGGGRDQFPARPVL